MSSMIKSIPSKILSVVSGNRVWKTCIHTANDRRDRQYSRFPKLPRILSQLDKIVNNRSNCWIDLDNESRLVFEGKKFSCWFSPLDRPAEEHLGLIFRFRTGTSVIKTVEKAVEEYRQKRLVSPNQLIASVPTLLYIEMQMYTMAGWEPRVLNEKTGEYDQIAGDSGEESEKTGGLVLDDVTLDFWVNDESKPMDFMLCYQRKSDDDDPDEEEALPQDPSTSRPVTVD